MEVRFPLDGYYYCYCGGCCFGSAGGVDCCSVDGNHAPGPCHHDHVPGHVLVPYLQRYPQSCVLQAHLTSEVFLLNIYHMVDQK